MTAGRIGRVLSTILIAGCLVAATTLPAAAGSLKPTTLLRPQAASPVQAWSVGAAGRTLAGAASASRLSLKRGAQPMAPAATLSSAAKAASRTAAKPSLAVTGPAAVTDGPLLAGITIGSTTYDNFLCCTPPDSTGAMGFQHYVEMVNSQVSTYTRSLTEVSSMEMGAFVGAPAGLQVSDPQVEWDSQTGLFLYAIVIIGTHNNFLGFGWSKTADPTDLANGWCRFGISTGTKLEDYPKLGHSNTLITIGSNEFDDTTGAFVPVTAQIWAIPKPAGMAACVGPSAAYAFSSAAAPLRNADGTLADTPVPANTIDSVTPSYVVAAHAPTGAGPQSKLMLWQVNPGSVPVLQANGDMSVVTYDLPSPVPQPGTAFTLDALDGRLTQAVAHTDPDAAGGEAIWTQHTVNGPGGRSVVDWYEILPASLAVRQQGVLSSPTTYVFNAAIAPSIAGNDAAIFYNRGSATQVALEASQSRRGVTPLGTMDPMEGIAIPSLASDIDLSCTPVCRWGDYAGATPDPYVPHLVWGSQQIDIPSILGLPQWLTLNFLVLIN
jgi:hypothetical protein